MDKQKVDPVETLREELTYYESMKSEWVKTHSGRVALIKGSELIGWYDDEKKAYEDGVRCFVSQPFLIKRILEQDPTVSAPAYTLGLLRAVH